jgi:hypothetical protein
VVPTGLPLAKLCGKQGAPILWGFLLLRLQLCCQCLLLLVLVHEPLYTTVQASGSCSYLQVDVLARSS